jgi:hypothetical protein
MSWEHCYKRAAKLRQVSLLWLPGWKHWLWVSNFIVSTRTYVVAITVPDNKLEIPCGFASRDSNSATQTSGPVEAPLTPVQRVLMMRIYRSPNDGALANRLVIGDLKADLVIGVILQHVTIGETIAHCEARQSG